MAGITVKRFDQPDETRPFKGHGMTSMVMLGERPAARAVLEPGWAWSQDVKPIAGTASCEFRHLGYCLEGRLRVRMDDGTTQEIGPGDAFVIESGHDAEVVGDERCVLLDFGEVTGYATAQ